MGRKAKRSSVSSVKYEYIGSDEQFGKFVKSVAKDYIANMKLSYNSDVEESVKKSA